MISKSGKWWRLLGRYVVQSAARVTGFELGLRRLQAGRLAAPRPRLGCAVYPSCAQAGSRPANLCAAGGYPALSSRFDVTSSAVGAEWRGRYAFGAQCAWALYDAPRVVYALARFALCDEPAVQAALDHLA